MKKKVFFIVMAIIQIIAAINVIATAESIVEETVTVYNQINSMMPMDMMEEMIEMVEEKGAASLRACSGLCILVNMGILITSIKNRILRNKGLMIAGTVVGILLGGSDVAILLSIIGLIVLLASKRTNPEDFPEKKELPVLEKIATSKREIIIGILIAVVYFSQFIWGEYIPDNEILSKIIEYGFYLVVLVLSIMFWTKSLKRDLKSLKENLGTYLKHILINLGIMYLVMMVVNIVVIGLTGSITSANQEGLEAMPTWYVVPLALIYAPIVEETIFRGLIHKGIKNKYVFIIASAISFGLLHTITSEVTLLNICLKAMPYAVMGGFLARIYNKTENITTSMLSHFMINLFASIVTL